MLCVFHDEANIGMLKLLRLIHFPWHYSHQFVCKQFAELNTLIIRYRLSFYIGGTYIMLDILGYGLNV